MAIKRKRSDSEISTSSCSMVSTSSPSNVSSPMGVQYIRQATPSHLPSRTLKRYRDNRPSDSMIHQHTLSKLFLAQRNPQATPIPSRPAPPPIHNASSQQTSLHSFWALPSWSSSHASNASTYSPPAIELFPITHCEDCNATLGEQDGDAMDIDGVYRSPAEYACSMCGRQVCHQCSVSNLGEQKQCLVCAGNKRWIGGIGWIEKD